MHFVVRPCDERPLPMLAAAGAGVKTDPSGTEFATPAASPGEREGPDENVRCHQCRVGARPHVYFCDTCLSGWGAPCGACVSASEMILCRRIPCAASYRRSQKYGERIGADLWWHRTHRDAQNAPDERMARDRRDLHNIAIRDSSKQASCAATQPKS